jgi:hypothetical protein
MKQLNSVAVLSSILISVFAAAPSMAGESSKAISSTTDLGDGIQMSQYADQSGFEMSGGGAQLTYDVGSKIMTMIDPNGVRTSVSFGGSNVAASSVQAIVSQR